MSYQPQIQPPPTTGNPEFDIWMAATIKTIQEFMVKSRELGNGLQYDELDRPEVGFTYMFMHKV